VKVYVAVVVLLIVVGFQVPVMPLVEVAGNAGGVAPLHIGPIAVKLGSVLLLMLTVTVETAAHWPALGVKVYVAVVVLLTVAGFQVPAIPLLDVAGNMGAVAPLQMAVGMLKAGVTSGLTVSVTALLVTAGHPGA